MIKILFDKNEAIIKFPKSLISIDSVQELIGRIKFESIIENSKLKEEEAWRLSEELKKEWWEKNKNIILEKIEKNYN